MKALSTIIASLCLASAAFAAPPSKVYDCSGGSGNGEYLRIYRSQTGQFTAKLKTYSTPEIMDMTCEHKGRGLFYVCRAGDYIAQLAMSAQNQPTVWLELDGDFGPTDSGSLLSFPCK